MTGEQTAVSGVGISAPSNMRLLRVESYLSVQIRSGHSDDTRAGMHSEDPRGPWALLQNAILQACMHRVRFISVCGTNHSHCGTYMMGKKKKKESLISRTAKYVSEYLHLSNFNNDSGNLILGVFLIRAIPSLGRTNENDFKFIT